jgi:hypothetical protein
MVIIVYIEIFVLINILFATLERLFDMFVIIINILKCAFLIFLYFFQIFLTFRAVFFGFLEKIQI